MLAHIWGILIFFDSVYEVFDREFKFSIENNAECVIECWFWFTFSKSASHPLSATAERIQVEQTIFSLAGGRSKILVEKKIRDIVKRFGSYLGIGPMDFAEALSASNQNIEELFGPTHVAQKICLRGKVVRARSVLVTSNCICYVFRFFFVEVWHLRFDGKISCGAFVFSLGLNSDSWFYIAVQLGFHVFVFIGLVFLVECFCFHARMFGPLFCFPTKSHALIRDPLVYPNSIDFGKIPVFETIVQVSRKWK